MGFTYGILAGETPLFLCVKKRVFLLLPMSRRFCCFGTVKPRYEQLNLFAMTKADFLAGKLFDYKDGGPYRYVKGDKGSNGYIERVYPNDVTHYYCSIDYLEEKGFRAMSFLFGSRKTVFLWYSQLTSHE